MRRTTLVFSSYFATTRGVRSPIVRWLIPTFAQQPISATPALVGLLVALIGLWIVAFAALGYPWTMVGSSTDGLHYLWMADALHAGVSHPQSAAGANLLWHSRFPPGFPIYLSLFGAATSDGGMLRANLAQMLSVLAMMLMVLVYARQHTRSWLAALLILGYVLAHPMLVPWSVELFSEPLFTCLLLAACLLAGADRSLSRAWLWMSMLIGFACLVRAIGLLVIPALLLWLWLRHRSVWRTIVGGMLALAPSGLWSALKPSSVGAGDSYLSQLWGTVGDISASTLTVIATQLSSFLQALAPFGFPAWLRLLIGTGLLIAFLRVVWLRRSQANFDAWAALSIMGILIFWPYPGYLDRLVGPIVPLLWVQILRGAPTPSEQPIARRVWIMAATLLVVIAMSSTLSILLRPVLRVADLDLQRQMRSASVLLAEDPVSIAKIHHAGLLLAADLHSLVPAGACVSSAFAIWVRLRAKVLILDTAQPFSWQNNPCRYVMVINLASAQDGFNAYYPMPLSPAQFRPLAVARESPDAVTFAALIEAND